MSTKAGEAERTSAATQGSKGRKFAVRTVSTVVLIAVFLGIGWAGHIPCAALMFCFQVRRARPPNLPDTRARPTRVPNTAPPNMRAKLPACRP